MIPSIQKKSFAAPIALMRPVREFEREQNIENKDLFRNGFVVAPDDSPRDVACLKSVSSLCLISWATQEAITLRPDKKPIELHRGVKAP
ncbi:CBM20 domain-containing protein [Gluconacetobacter asukensis]|uniref:Uncharacterized protein n=1 Tax=Gluconacetobacter asukensis TaxID=1017181 RepID=A0A7W4P1A9_9PROT|nr:hypothetical protein [Gluconacetobacter asukensis]MBB2173579.1 hypothetical protein [Gluconacetobacter asukensis]